MGDHATSPDTGKNAGSSKELLLRIASAIVMGAVSLTLTWSGLWPFSMLALAVALVVLWEWGRVVRNVPPDGLYYASAAVVTAAIGLSATHHAVIALILLAAAAVAMLAASRRSDGPMAAMGLLYTGLSAIALVWLRSSESHGLAAVLFVFFIVWGADTGAFAAGRTFGGPKLWPAVSPKKTWAGLIGALAAGSLIAWAFTKAVTHGNPALACLIGAGLAFVSQGGDLMESAIKRRHGVKDASQLIPGHGGFMDRVDGLIFAVVAAAIYALIRSSQDPAAALLALN